MKKLQSTTILQRCREGADEFLSVVEAATLFKLTEACIRRWIFTKKLRSFRIGGSVRILLSDLQKMTEEVPKID